MHWVDIHVHPFLSSARKRAGKLESKLSRICRACICPGQKYSSLQTDRIGIECDRLNWLGPALRVPRKRLPRCVLFYETGGAWRMGQNGQSITWQESKATDQWTGSCSCTYATGFGFTKSSQSMIGDNRWYVSVLQSETFIDLKSFSISIAIQHIIFLQVLLVFLFSFA